MANHVKEKIEAGEITYGIWAESFDPDLIELCGYMGFEYVMFDAEGTSFDYRQAGLLFRTCEVAGMIPIVRIPEISSSIIQSYLNLGAQGIYVPHVSTAADALAVVDAVRFPPAGNRGAGSFRWARFGVDGDMAERYRQANDDIIVIALIEDPLGVENLDEIIAVEGIDVFGVGPGDLSLAMGYPSGQNHREVRSIVVSTEEKVRAAGKVFDAVVSSAEEARDSIERGALMVSYVLRSMVLNSGRAFLSALADATPGSAVTDTCPEEGVVK